MVDLLTKDVASRAQVALSSSPIHALRELHVEIEDEMLYISGRVDTFYHKQMAQEVVRVVARGTQVVNAIDVDQLDIAQLDIAQLDIAQLDIAQLDIAQLDIAQLDIATLFLTAQHVVVISGCCGHFGSWIQHVALWA